jgi:hypothetical protein
VRQQWEKVDCRVLPRETKDIRLVLKEGEVLEGSKDALVESTIVD